MEQILVIIVCIIIIFFLSHDNRFNKLISNQSVPLILLLIFFYFVFNKLDIKILFIAIIVLILFNSNIYNLIRRYSNGEDILEKLTLKKNIENIKDDDDEDNIENLDNLDGYNAVNSYIDNTYDNNEINNDDQKIKIEEDNIISKEDLENYDINDIRKMFEDLDKQINDNIKNL
jgi:hypothetical protein